MRHVVGVQNAVVLLEQLGESRARPETPFVSEIAPERMVESDYDAFWIPRLLDEGPVFYGEEIVQGNVSFGKRLRSAHRACPKIHRKASRLSPVVRIILSEILSMTPRKVALKHAAELAETNPAKAYDLVLATAERVAVKSPAVVTLNRALRGVKTEAVKYLNQETPGLVWEAGDTFNNISLGSTFSLFGRSEADGPSAMRIEVRIYVPNNTDRPDEYSIGASPTRSKGNRSLNGDRLNISLADMKKPAMWLKNCVKSINDNLKGSLEAEKTRLLGYMDGAEQALKDIEPVLKETRSLIEKSDNLVVDASSILQTVWKTHVYTLDSSIKGLQSLLSEIQKSGG